MRTKWGEQGLEASERAAGLGPVRKGSSLRSSGACACRGPPVALFPVAPSCSKPLHPAPLPDHQGPFDSVGAPAELSAADSSLQPSPHTNGLGNCSHKHVSIEQTDVYS